MRTALMAVAAVVFASLSMAAPASAQGLSFPLPGEGGEPSAAQPAQAASPPAVSPFRTESLSEQWDPKTNPPTVRNQGPNCKDAATKMAEQSPTPPTSVACY